MTVVMPARIWRLAEGAADGRKQQSEIRKKTRVVDSRSRHRQLWSEGLFDIGKIHGDVVADLDTVGNMK